MAAVTMGLCTVIVQIEIRPLYDNPLADKVMILSLNFESNFVSFSNNSNCCCENMLFSFMKDSYQGMKLLSFLFSLLVMIIKN